MPRALKVYRMAVGFHDAYVAAASQKAAAEAWGTDTAVFSRKEAELVTDPKLTAEPLAAPGKVIKRLRGTAAEQIAALGPDQAPSSPKGARTSPANGKSKAKPSPKPKPRPSRTALEAAEQALEAEEERQRQERQELAEREAALAREREALERKQRQERERLETRRQKAEAAYEAALRRWRES